MEVMNICIQHLQTAKVVILFTSELEYTRGRLETTFLDIFVNIRGTFPVA